MTSANGNGNATRALCVVLIAVLVVLIGGVTWNVVANAQTNERVARLEAQTDYIIKSLERIERAVVVKGDNR